MSVIRVSSFDISVGYVVVFFFFFQAEDGIRDYKVTGVQTCALPISLDGLTGSRTCPGGHSRLWSVPEDASCLGLINQSATRHCHWSRYSLRLSAGEIGRASCRERV